MPLQGNKSVTTIEREKRELETIRLHGKTFKAWCNAYLKKRKIRIADMERDFCDGIYLIQLIELLTGDECPIKYNTNPKMDIHKIENCSIAVDFIGKYIRVNINAHDLAQGNQKVLLGLIWRLILQFQVMSKEERESKKSAHVKNREAKKKLLQWIQQQTQGYNGVNVTNFDTSFQDGLAFCALVNKFDDGLLDFNALNPSNIKENMTAAFRIAEEKMGIPQLLDVDDFLADPDSRPDENCVMTYLSEFPRAFLEKMERMREMEEKERKRLEKERELEELQSRNLEQEPPQMLQPMFATTMPVAGDGNAGFSSTQSFQVTGGPSPEELERIRRENERLMQQLEAMRGCALVGVITVGVLEARGLKAKNYGGKSDPYCMLQVERQREKTKKVKNSINPKWNAEFKFYVSDPEAVFEMEILNWNRFLADDFLGRLAIPVSEMVSGKQTDQWYTLLPRKAGHKVSGEVKVRVLYEMDPRKMLAMASQ